MPLERALVDERLATGAERTLMHLGKVPHVRLLVPAKASHIREAFVTHLTPVSDKQGSSDTSSKDERWPA